jgi:hypothetical protein
MVAADRFHQSFLNDEMVSRVTKALLDFDEVRFDRISVRAFYGIIELTGEVPNFRDKDLAVGIVERLYGVSTVLESLKIRAVSPRKSSVARPRYRFDEAHVRSANQMFPSCFYSPSQ